MSTGKEPVSTCRYRHRGLKTRNRTSDNRHASRSIPVNVLAEGVGRVPASTGKVPVGTGQFPKTSDMLVKCCSRGQQTEHYRQQPAKVPVGRGAAGTGEYRQSPGEYRPIFVHVKATSMRNSESTQKRLTSLKVHVVHLVAVADWARIQ